MPARISTKRFAQASFDVAKATNSLDKWLSDLRDLAEAVSNSELSDFLENPRLLEASKRDVLKKVIPGIGDGVVNLALFLIVKGKLSGAQGIAEDFDHLLDEQRGIVRASVKTAIPLDEAEKNQVMQQLAKVTGKQIKLETKVDPSLMGGMVLRVGDRVLDGSVKARLEALRQSLVERATV